MANIVITGASRGLGFEFVKELSKFSTVPKIIALCRTPDKAEKLQSLASNSKNISIVKADMADFDAYGKVVADIQQHVTTGGINLVINNAGIMVKDNIHNVTKKNLLESFELNSLAPLLFTKALLPMLKNADDKSFPLNVGKSAVINISAHLGSIEENTTGGYLSYRISKVALNMITRTLSAELNPLNIFVMAFHPGWVKTDMGGEAAPLTPEVSVNSMLTVLSKVDESHRGNLYNSKGKKIPW